MKNKKGNRIGPCGWGECQEEDGSMERFITWLKNPSPRSLSVFTMAQERESFR